MDISRRKSEEVSYPLGETDQYEDQSKDIFNWILKDEMSDSDSEALIENYEQMRFCYWNKGAVKQWCQTQWFKLTLM